MTTDDRASTPFAPLSETPTDTPTAARAAAGAVESRARTLRFQRLANRIVRVLLRTPLICRVVGRRLVVVHVVGRTSGRHDAIPVAYTREGTTLVIGTPFRWGRNLQTGTPVTIRLKGRLRMADVAVESGESAVVAAYAVMARDNRNFASFNGIGIDADGRPDPDDLRLAWAAGARAIRLTPR